jgi:uncharacterized protein YndB with AHSA1/START domain
MNVPGSDQATIVPAPVRKAVTVPCPPARAFDLFAARMGRWWQPSHSISASGQADVVIEPRVGGRWYEVGRAGEQCDWGEVAVWEPPVRLVLFWRLSAEFVFDPALQTEVDVTFTPEGKGTRVVLEHRGLENYGAMAEPMRATFDSPRGWGGLLAAYAAAAGA